VKWSYRRLVFVVAFIMALGWSPVAQGAPAPKDKEKEHSGQKVDAGSFGVFQGGRRVGTETFSIYETGSGSVIESEFKTVNAPVEAVQTSEMRLSTTGEIQRYEWKELSPEKAVSVVLPNDDFLMQKWSLGGEKEHEQPYLLGVKTCILDDYFFVHREVLAWKFLGASCKQDKAGLQCPLKQRAQFGTLNPRQHSSAPLSAEFLGREKVTLKAGQQDLLKVELKNDAGTWQLWLDDQFKVMRMAVVGDNTVVDRD
jgi:hypothetical protein